MQLDRSLPDYQANRNTVNNPTQQLFYLFMISVKELKIIVDNINLIAIAIFWMLAPAILTRFIHQE